MFEIVFTTKARKAYERLSKRAVRLVDRALASVERDPYAGPQIKRLHGTLDGLLRIRAGEYRILYEIQDSKRVVAVLVIGTRGNVY